MKFITKYYYLPFFIGIIFSILFWVSSIDIKLKTEGFAKINVSHPLSDETSTLYWQAVNRDILEKYNYLTVRKKRGFFRFYSANNDIEEIKKNYQEIKNEYEKYKKIYISDLGILLKKKKLQRDLDSKTIKKIDKGLKYLSDLSEQEFLLELKTNQIIIRNYQIIYIIILISFLFSIILYNLKKVFFK